MRQNAVQQAEGFGLTQRFKVVCDVSNEFVIARALKSAVFPHWSVLYYDPASNKGNPLSDQFIADYIAKTNDLEPLGLVGEAHSDVQALAKAIAAAGSTDTRAVIAKREGLTWDTVTGTRTIRAEDNQAIKDVEIVYLECGDRLPGAGCWLAQGLQDRALHQGGRQDSDPAAISWQGGGAAQGLKAPAYAGGLKQ